MHHHPATSCKDVNHDCEYSKLQNIKYLMAANQDVTKLRSHKAIFSGPAIEFDLFSQYKTQIDANKKEKKPYHEGLPPVAK